MELATQILIGAIVGWLATGVITFIALAVTAYVVYKIVK